MFGVVLWSDSQDQKAVIWCEDHGDLAYYRQTDMAPGLSLDAGDWVQFDVTEGDMHRRAYNPRLIAEGVCPDLGDRLGVCARTSRQEPAQRASSTRAQVIAFPSARQSCRA